MAEEKITQAQEDYNSSKSYNQLVYGRYIFMAKVAVGLLLIVLLLYVILTRIGKSLGETVVLPTVEEFLAKNEKGRARDRVKVQLSLLKQVLDYRKDTVVILIDDDKYQIYNDAGVYDFPEQRMIYGGRLFAMELMLKRSLLEMQYPFIFTHVIHKDSPERAKFTGYTEVTSRFPMLFPPSLKSTYTVKVVDSTSPVPVYEHTVALRDSIAAQFAEFYATSSAEKLTAQFLGSGPTGPYKYLTIDQFRKLSVAEQQEQRRAFLQLSEKEQDKARNLDLPISAEFYCVPWDEKPGSYFKTLIEQKMHELDIKALLLPFYNHATFSLKYPMVRAANLNFSAIGANKNSLMLVALKSGRAPAMYKLERKDCPRILKQGLFADITDLIADWDQAKNFPVGPMSDATYGGRKYGIPSRNLQIDALMYRRDWIEESPVMMGWFQKKGWIHPVDGRPYIPFNWNYDEFVELISLYKSTDPTGKRKGYVQRPGSMLYMEAYGLMDQTEYLKFSGKEVTWKFDSGNKRFKEGMKKVHDLVWYDKTIRTGVEVTYDAAQDDFFGSRAGIAYTFSSAVLTKTLNSKYSIFGRDKEFGKIVGLTTTPGSAEYPNSMLSDCDLVGFSPKLSPDQLYAAVEWVKSFMYAEFVYNALFFDVKEARLQGTESLVLRNAMASVYDIDFKSLDVDYRGFFSPIMVDFYDSLRAVQKRTSISATKPKFEEFGLSPISLRAIQDQVNMIFEKALMDSVPNYDEILSSCEGYVNSSLLNFKDENDKDKVHNYLQSIVKYTKVDTISNAGRAGYLRSIKKLEQFRKEQGL
ncbi:MAG: hypothetical protein JNL74_07990 [Fibrobacteres bacterium]|nr:hypothetical protein [Fibrobacterota bacterium]